MQYLTIICGALVALVGFVFWMWREDKKHCHSVKTEEAKRLYSFIDDMFDRINSDTIEQYAMTHRIKKDIMVQSVNVPKTRGKKEITEEEHEPAFVHQKR